MNKKITSSKLANSEQRLAIEHEGGVLLKAGAGSGKTFVLVEHIIYLTEKWIEDFKVKPVGNFEEFIRQKFSKVVMMTFTKKAAGEMNIRLTDKFLEMISGNDPYWITANEALPLLMVTTIDGFCRKLISNGYFPHLSTDAKIIFETERTNQVREQVEKWFELKSSKIRPEILDIIIREKKALLSAFTNVFNDPGLRLAWKKFDSRFINPKNIDQLLSQSFALNDLSASLAKIHLLDLPHETDRSAFEKVVGNFQATGLPEVDSVDKLKIYANLFSAISTLRGESGKKKSPVHDGAKDGLFDLRVWVRKWEETIADYSDHFESKVLPWMNLCQELFKWIDTHLDPNQGMTFGDIEYHVACGLENREDLDRIQKVFRYFIVDEFQDTSSLQFQIIRDLIGGDFNRLFCVGDAKQAIYGFRGGELSVFQDCEELVPKVLTLANNYRSMPEVIEFNNSLFRAVLPLGQDFSGLDPFSVSPEDQNIPQDLDRKSESGLVEILKARIDRDIEVDGKLDNEDINRIEANLIASSIKKNQTAQPHEVCTVLYSKLKPSGELIRTLMEQKISFTAQFKIDLLDDPILGIFLGLIRRQFDSDPKTRDVYALFLIQSYLTVLGIDRACSPQDLAQFELNIKFWGLIESFRKFIHSLSITNENSDINVEVIETIAKLYHQDPESIMIQLIDGHNQRLSMDLRVGENSHMVQIMSAHASKGLEFDTVYLGGIYTNGRSMIDHSIFGDYPGSFSWYMDLGQRDRRKSPFYVFEEEMNRYKNFSEAKRLFYVACTRAKKKLIWVDLELPSGAFSIPKNSWIDGLTAWHASPEVVKISESEDANFDPSKLLMSQSRPELPLFFHDQVGIMAKDGALSELSISSELSVTRLNSLIDCPRKFYLENTLKLNGHEVTFIPSDDEEEMAGAIKSSAARGTSIHAHIAKGIDHNFVVAREIFNDELKGPIEWALNLLKELQDDFKLIPEKQLKFKFFNFMISGIPDLVLIPSLNQNAQVWDFKTGRITQDNLSHYWLQLSIYAYALYALEQVPKNQEIELVLCFVDQKKTQNKMMTWNECSSTLFNVWRSQSEPWKINPDHCSQCSFNEICLK